MTTKMNLNLKLVIQKLIFFLISASLLLSFLDLFGIFCQLYLKTDLKGFVWIIAVDGDGNIGTWYSSIILLISSLLLIFIATLKTQQNDRRSRKWFILGIIFLVLSIDEVATIHERSTNLIHVSALGGFLYYSWVIFGIIFVSLVFFYYIDFLKDLPARTRNLFLLSGGIYVGGALGMEMIDAKLAYTKETVLYAIGTNFEELCEMLAIVLFIFSLLNHIRINMNIEVIKFNFLSKHDLEKEALTAREDN